MLNGYPTTPEFYGKRGGGERRSWEHITKRIQAIIQRLPKIGSQVFGVRKDVMTFLRKSLRRVRLLTHS